MTMDEIRHHAHVYLLLIASIILGLGGMLSLWRMHEIERQYATWEVNQQTIIGNQSKILDQLNRIEQSGR